MMIRIWQLGAMMLLLAASAACAQPFRHCVTTDGKDACVCDPDRGHILVVHDSFPAAKP